MRYIITLLATATPTLAEVPSVVTDIPPVHALVAEVMGDLGQPVLLLDRGADEHNFQLRPSQAGAVANAALVVWIGPELTPWLDSAMEIRPEGAAALALLDAEGTVRRSYAAEETKEAGHDDHAHEEAGHDDHAAEEAGHDDHAHEEAAHDDHAAEAKADDHAHEGHAHDGTDPHAWLDPGNAQVWLGLIATELARLDPQNAAVYTANAAAATEQLAAVDAAVSATLAPVQGKPLVTYHDAYGYFAEHYGLNVIGSIAEGDASTPGAARLAELRSKVEAGQVLCLFPEIQHDPALITQMAEGTGAKIGGTLDPVGSSLEAGPDAYAALLTGMAQTIADCVGG